MSESLNIEVLSLPDVPFCASFSREETRPPVVLVVDDEPMIADTLSFILSRNGYTVLTAYDAKSALDLASVIPPELLVSDVTMAPEMDGVELAMELVKTVPDCGVLLVSGQAGTRDLLAVSRGLGHSFTLLAKPLHPTALLAYIATFMESRGLSGRRADLPQVA